MIFLDENTLFAFFFSIPGIIELMEFGALGVQFKIIRDQADRLNAYENGISNMEALLRDLLDRPDTPQESKEKIRKVIKTL